MAEFVKVADRGAIPPGTGKVVQAGGKALALFNVAGQFYAIDNTCRHRGGPLGEGMLDGTTVTCPWHGWQWDVCSGASAFNPAISVGCYPTKVEGNDVMVQV
ncbi:MAG: non-heme iron oxygenase ferredoxin subunit [Planctomycetota bacterium]|nr:MAG: non-heme iron oxygenase ferredoxin subunit [Planctomycetota bacterium]